jgi:hypothetical protein
VRGTKAVLPVLLVVVLLGAVLAGCGGSDEKAKADLAAAITPIEAAIADLTAKGTSGALDVAGIKAARDEMKSKWQAVIDAAKKVKGADVKAAEQAWNDLDAAVTALPDTATLMDAAGVLMTKVPAFTKVLSDLKALTVTQK